jgi:hypothetical protein
MKNPTAGCNPWFHSFEREDTGKITAVAVLLPIAINAPAGVPIALLGLAPFLPMAIPP